MRLVALLSGFLALAAPAFSQTSAHWDYYGKTGPLGWARLDPAYRACAEGHEQSPIDIHGAHLNKALHPIEFHYMAGAVTLENTGNTILVHVHPGSYIVAGGVRYDLEYFDFHHPSEEAVSRKLTDMDVHLVHKSADGKLAILAVRFSVDRGDPNATMAALWEHLPTTAGATDKIDAMINPGGFLPADPGYWTYMGSLTTPPCTEGVRWFVFEQPVTMSLTQLRTFAALFRMNSRQVQDAHGRRIEADE
jgi:carbonic anhydrase